MWLSMNVILRLHADGRVEEPGVGTGLQAIGLLV